MCNKKGFTLVELLGVFVLLGIITIITTPYITGMLKQSKSGEYDRFENNVFLAAESYIQTNGNRYDELKINGGIVYVSINELVESGFLSKNITNPKTKSRVDLNDSVKVEKKSTGLEYTFMDSNYSTDGYVKNGLILHYDGYKIPYKFGINKYWEDLSGNENNGLMIGFDSSSGWQNNSMNLDGLNDAIDVGLANYDFGKNITLETVVKVNSTKTYSQEFFGNWEGAGGGFYYNTANKLGINFYIEEVTTYKGIVFPATIGTWYVLDGTYDGTTMKLYSNGELKSNLAISGTLKESPVPIGLGANPGTTSYANYSNISIAHVAIYNRALTETEIKQNYGIAKRRFNL